MIISESFIQNIATVFLLFRLLSTRTRHNLLQNFLTFVQLNVRQATKIFDNEQKGEKIQNRKTKTIVATILRCFEYAFCMFSNIQFSDCPEKGKKFPWKIHACVRLSHFDCVDPPKSKFEKWKSYFINFELNVVNGFTAIRMILMTTAEVITKVSQSQAPFALCSNKRVITLIRQQSTWHQPQQQQQ